MMIRSQSPTGASIEKTTLSLYEVPNLMVLDTQENASPDLFPLLWMDFVPPMEISDMNPIETLIPVH